MQLAEDVPFHVQGQDVITPRSLAMLRADMQKTIVCAHLLAACQTAKTQHGFAVRLLQDSVRGTASGLLCICKAAAVCTMTNHPADLECQSWQVTTTRACTQNTQLSQGGPWLCCPTTEAGFFLRGALQSRTGAFDVMRPADNRT